MYESERVKERERETDRQTARERERELRESFQGYTARNSSVLLRTYQRYFAKFSVFGERRILRTLPLSFSSRSRGRRIYFSPEACAELSKIPACRLARASALRRNAKSLVGPPPSPSRPRPRGRTLVANLTRRTRRRRCSAREDAHVTRVCVLNSSKQLPLISWKTALDTRGEGIPLARARLCLRNERRVRFIAGATSKSSKI